MSTSYGTFGRGHYFRGMARIFPAAGSGGGRCCLCRRWPSKGGGFRSVGRAPRRPAAAVTPQEKGPLRQLCAPQRGARWRSWCRLYLIHCRGAAALRRHRGTAAQRSVAGQKTGRIPGGQRMITVHMDEVGFEVRTCIHNRMMQAGQGIFPPCKAKNRSNTWCIARFFNAAGREKTWPDCVRRL